MLRIADRAIAVGNAIDTTQQTASVSATITPWHASSMRAGDSQTKR